MSLNIIKLKDQANGQFNGGAILENKPIGFPQDGGILKPYSNLFYWAHAWTPGERSLIGEHPHQGFEILSFVLKGSIEHYDNKNKDWRKLNEGDAQIIRSGSGITHAELVNKESEFFQIWFDPSLEETLGHEPSYDDFIADSFPVIEQEGVKTKIYYGEGSPLSMHSKGIEIKEKTFEAGRFTLSLNPKDLHSIYLMEGRIEINENKLETKDFLIIKEESELNIESSKPFKLFMISSPQKLDYKTYAELIRSGAPA